MNQRSHESGKLFFILFSGLILILSGCNAAQDTGDGGGTVRVVATIAQIGEPLAAIGGDLVHVTSLMGPGVDPHLYEAAQSDIRKLDQADVIFYNGLHLEGKMGEIFAQMKKNKRTLALAETLDEKDLIQEGGAFDPHVWFDIDLWKEALDAAVSELAQWLPEHAEQLTKNKEDYFAQLDELKNEATRKLASIPEEQRVLVTAHDAFGYFGRMFGMEVVGLQGLSTEDEVGISDIQATVDLLVERKIPAVFVESSVNENSIRAVIDGAKKAGWDVALGGELFSDAMGKPGTKEGTYIGMYEHNVNTIFRALGGKEDTP